MKFIRAICNSLLFLCLAVKVCFSQFTHVKTLAVTSEKISTDNLGNIFTLEKGIITKYDENGKLLNVFQSKTGLIDFIDASNPLRIIGYSTSFATIYIFDSQLSLQSTINLREKLNNDPSLVCNSSTANFWVYDQSTTILTSYNDQFQDIAQSQPLNLTVADFSNVRLMRENEKWLVLLTNDNRFLVFDLSGSYFKSIQANEVYDFGISDQAIIGLEKPGIKIHSIKSNEESDLQIDGVNYYQRLLFLRNKIYLGSATEIKIFELRD